MKSLPSPNRSLTLAAAPFRMPKALTMGGGMRSWGWLMREFSSERSVWAPQYLSAGTLISPKASLSVLVLAAILTEPTWKYLWDRGAGRETDEAGCCREAQRGRLVLDADMHVLKDRTLLRGPVIHRLAEQDDAVRAEPSMIRPSPTVPLPRANRLQKCPDGLWTPRELR